MNYLLFISFCCHGSFSKGIFLIFSRWIIPIFSRIHHTKMTITLQQNRICISIKRYKIYFRSLIFHCITSNIHYSNNKQRKHNHYAIKSQLSHLVFLLNLQYFHHFILCKILMINFVPHCGKTAITTSNLYIVGIYFLYFINSNTL